MISKSTENVTRLETFTVANNKVTFSADVTVPGNFTVYGNLSTTGTQTFTNTVFATTSALSVVNVMGTGPALYIGANGTGDIASFYDIDQNIEVLHVGGNNGTFPNVGVKTSTPNKTFTVNGEISASSDIWTGGKFRGDGSLLTGIVGGTANALPLSGGTLTGALVGQTASFTSVSAVALSGTFFGDGSKLTGIASGGTANALPLSGGTLTGALVGTTATFTSIAGTHTGNGAGLTGVVGTDSSKLPLAGGTLTGALVGTTATFTSIAGTHTGNGAGLTGVVGTDSSKLPLTGGTLTGALVGTTATFTSVSAVALSGTFFGDGSKLTGLAAPTSAVYGNKTGTYTLASTDVNSVISFNSSSICYLQVPSDAVSIPIGSQFMIIQDGTGNVVIQIVSGSGVVIQSYGSRFSTTGQYAMATLVKTASSTWRLGGTLS